MRSKVTIVCSFTIGLLVYAQAHGQASMAADATIATDSAKMPPQTQNIHDGITPLSSDQAMLATANKAYLISISLAALFGAGGIAATFFIVNYSNRVSDAQNLQVRQLERDRDVAKADAAKADARIADANKFAASADQKAAEARERSSIAEQNIASLNAYIAELTLPRILTDLQIVVMSSLLERFSGTEFAFAFTDGDTEITNLMSNIDNLLTRAKWKLIEWKGIGNRGVRPGRLEAGIIIANNVEIRVNSSREFLFKGAVESLVNILTTNGITAVASQMNEFDPNENVIQIIVGKKTLPPPPKLASLPPMTQTP